VLRDLMISCLSAAPEWMGPVTNNERLAMNDRPLLDQLNDIAANHDDRIVINRRVGELTLNFGGDNVQANNFEKLVPAFALKRRFADSVTIDLSAVSRFTASKHSLAAAGWLVGSADKGTFGLG
jgi:hypothetical protein